MSGEAKYPLLEAALDRYDAAVSAFEGGGGDASALLAALVRRGELAAALAAGGGEPAVIRRVVDLDHRVRKAAAWRKDVDWEAWRRAVRPLPEQWWWHLDRLEAEKVRRGEFLPVLLAGVAMTVTLGIGVDISQRLWGGGADSLSVVSAAFTLLLTGGPLTSQGRELAAWILEQLKLPGRYRGGTMLAAALLFLATALLLRLVALPAWAQLTNNRGVGLLLQGNLKASQRAFARAVSINTEYASGYYNLAGAYLGIGDYAQAESLYTQALAADRTFDLAYSGLGYVLTLQGEPERAIPLFYSGLNVAQDDEARVALWTNLAQAYLAAGRPSEAGAALAQALSVDSEDGAALCTAALVAEAQGASADRLCAAWEECLRYADPTTPSGQDRSAMARSRLEALEE